MTVTGAPPRWGHHRQDATCEPATIEDVTSGDVRHASHFERSTSDQWELAVLSERGGATPSPPTRRYQARKLWRFVDAL